MQVGSALALPSGLGSEPSRLAPCSRTPTTITRIITRMATTAITHPPRRTIRQRRITRPHGAAGTPITVPTTLVEYARAPAVAAPSRHGGRGLYPRLGS